MYNLHRTTRERERERESAGERQKKKSLRKAHDEIEQRSQKSKGACEDVCACMCRRQAAGEWLPALSLLRPALGHVQPS